LLAQPRRKRTLSTLIVFLPPRDPALPSREWQLPEMPFLLLDRSGRKDRAGRAALSFLPRATTTVLIVAARDVLMLSTTLPPLKGQRLRQALPNVVEDQTIQDSQTCHIALDPEPLPDGARVLAIIDRGWFRFIVDAFSAAGHRSLRAVPVTRCLPAAQAYAYESAEPALADERATTGAAAATRESGATESSATHEDTATLASSPIPAPLIAAVLGIVRETVPAILAEVGAGAASTPPLASLAATDPRVEVGIARGALGEGLAVPASSLGATLAALAGDKPLTVLALSDVPDAKLEEKSAVTADAVPALVATTYGLCIGGPAGSKPLPFETLARAALACHLDLCQFEFESRPWRLNSATLRRLRLPVALALVSLAVAVIGSNVQWFMLARERDALNAQMTGLLLEAFPKTAVVLDAPVQLKTQLERLRLEAGQLLPDDFLSLAARLAPALGPLPVNGIAALAYHDRRLDVTFMPQVTADPDFTKRLAQNGLTGELDTDTGKWVVRNRTGL
jgi:general secretion pathway protein L